jgi:hypothetical protein
VAVKLQFTIQFKKGFHPLKSTIGVKFLYAAVQHSTLVHVNEKKPSPPVKYCIHFRSESFSLHAFKPALDINLTAYAFT